MSAYKFYSWEKGIFGKHYSVEVKPEYRKMLATKIAEHFKLWNVQVNENLRKDGKGMAWGKYRIDIPSAIHRCSLGLIIHELAHLYDDKHFGGKGHGKTYRHSLIKLMVETWNELPKMFREIKIRIAEMQIEQERHAQKLLQEAERKETNKRLAKTPERKIEKIKQKISKWESRKKRAENKLKSLNRSLIHLERWQKIKNNNPMIERVLKRD